MSSIAGPNAEVNRLTHSQLSSSAMRMWLSRFASALFFLTTRLAFGLLCLLTSVYCLLLYIPFSYFGFIHDPILWWLPAFVKLHPYLYSITFVAVGITLITDLRKATTRLSAAAFLLLNGGACFYLIRLSPLAHLHPDFATCMWSILSLFPVVWLGAIDAASASARASEKRAAVAPRARADLASLLLFAIAIACGFAVVSTIGDVIGTVQHLPYRTRLLGTLISVGAHVAIFATVGCVFLLAGKVSAWFRWSDLVDSVLTRLLAWILCSLAVLKIALPTLSFSGMQADAVSAALGLALVVGFVGTASRLRLREVELSGKGGSKRAWLWGVAACIFLLLAYAIPSVIAKTDWDFVLQKVAVLLLWAAGFILLRKSNISLKQLKQRRLLAATLAAAITFATMIAFHAGNSAEPQDGVWNNLIDAYGGSDISFKTAADILSRSLDNGSHEGFYRLLQQHTNISAEIAPRPAGVELVSQLAAAKTKKPNIFIFVIDSLRQDYVPGYSADATFTPQIARFAGESIEFKKAFSRYAGTALSEPAIWVGALQAHKQYIQPFYPMNNLEKLLESEGYDSFVSEDPILGMLFPLSFPSHRLDAKIEHWVELDMVDTLAEIERDIDARPSQQKPIFVYTQPQNVHTVTLEQQKHGNTRREMSIYELKRIDKAFGEFIEFLKGRGLYENSIVVLTSDHGDSYGEFGRYGHADFLFPEVIRIPLIIHLPDEMRRKMVYNAEEVAFSMDITPSIFYLLGQRPILNREWLGRPLFTETDAERQAYLREDYLLVSSYAPVYGILSKDANTLFIVDAVNRRSYFYDLLNDPLGTKNEINARRWKEGEKEVRRQLSLLDQAYDLHFAN